MATTHSQWPASQPSPFSQHAHTPSLPKMYDIPDQLSPAQVEAMKILTHVLEKLKEPDSKYYARYGKWVERHQKLDDFCFRCVRPQVWTFLGGRWSLDGLKAIGGDLRFEGRGVYVNGVLGLDKRVRTYIGQASSLRQRFAQHLNFRYRRDNPSLHYLAIQKSIYNAFGTLALLPSPSMGNHTLPGMDSPDLLLNVIEMWMSLVFRSLPAQALEAWIPKGVDAGRIEGKEGEFGGLNIAVPLDQGGDQRDWIDLSECGDTLVLEYLGIGEKKAEAERKKRNDTPIANSEIKEEQDESTQTKKTDNVEEVFAERRRKYTELAKRRNRKKYAETLVSPVTVVAIGVAVVFGVMLLRSNGGPGLAPRGRLR
ncbi:hypothetical protein P153DRAFT_429832 [Dothidotthia symphoricarpi CBS 119687]|uniref:Uncharacterized protein n=1 Tax=Dothidotthia symphoricarpi CBS 119687 TaxID=1392245 RepID=A0A6A6AM58_9PLEO|nr:uncharacterized protein P153DRAFT_429832 [Dothidotthia symphoricarpi CBS 119687]KAF2131561.1 hypothetical protein P153DRAFT_429832 [Dothidotthia symphoricarpi CBS 119687]